jgi:hypothetical protein
VAAGGARGAPFITPAQNELLRTRSVPDRLRQGKLPKGAIHGDLFCDNVLFAEDARRGDHRLRFRRHRLLRLRPGDRRERLVHRRASDGWLDDATHARWCAPITRGGR